MAVMVVGGDGCGQRIKRTFFVGKVSKNFEREIKESKKSRFFFEDSV
jgi:hypothetical protein